MRVKHGLRSKTLALPNEDPAVIAERVAIWNDFYQPKSPAAQHLVNECVEATILSDRIHRYHHFAVSSQVRGAKEAWENAREEEVHDLFARLYDDPADVVSRLKRTGHGLRVLTARWEEFRKHFEADGCLNGQDCDDAITLLGCRSAIEDLREHPAAFMLCLFNALSNKAPSEEAILLMCEPENVPASLRVKIKEMPFRPIHECRAWVKGLIAKELSSLQEQADALQEIELRDYEEV